jgi:hypothetical protein
MTSVKAIPDAVGTNLDINLKLIAIFLPSSKFAGVIHSSPRFLILTYQVYEQGYTSNRGIILSILTI